MLGFLPNPHITAKNHHEQNEQINHYLFQLKQELELTLMNISEENLSDSLLARIRGIDNIETNKQEQTEINEILANKETKVEDVVKSDAFQKEISDCVILLNVNYETGKLEYITKGEKNGIK